MKKNGISLKSKQSLPKDVFARHWDKYWNMLIIQMLPWQTNSISLVLNLLTKKIKPICSCYERNTTCLYGSVGILLRKINCMTEFRTDACQNVVRLMENFRQGAYCLKH